MSHTPTSPMGKRRRRRRRKKERNVHSARENTWRPVEYLKHYLQTPIHFHGTVLK
jgi:hypothetical protein